MDLALVGTDFPVKTMDFWREHLANVDFVGVKLLVELV